MNPVSRRDFLGTGVKAAGLALAAGLAPELLAACGSSSSGTKSTSATPAGGTNTLNSFLKSAAKPYAGQQVNILAVSSPQALAIQAVVSEFEATTGIKVNFTFLSNTATILKTSVSLNAHSSAYDVYQIQSFYVPQYANSKYFVSVDALKGDAATTYDHLDLSVFAPAAIQGLTFASQLYGMPMLLATQVFFYRTDVFNKAGIKTLPKTLDDLQSVCAKIKSVGSAAITYRTGIGSTENLFPWTAWLYNFGGSYYRSFDKSTGAYSGPSLSSSKAISAGELYVKLIRDYGPPGSLNWTVADVTKSFLSGEAAMMQEGNTFGGAINNPKTSAVAGKVGAFPIPSGPGGSYYPSAAQGWAVSRYSDHREASWLFAQWASAPETMLQATLAADFAAPPTLATYKNASFVKKYNFTGFLDTVDLQNAAAHSSPIGGPYIPALLNWEAAGHEVSTFFNEAITGSRSVASAFSASDLVLKKYE
jgi:multiple sugar transport system substrate-binding protein